MDLKPYNPYYWPQGERPPVGIFTPRIRTPRDNNRNDRGRGKKNDRSERPKDLVRTNALILLI